MTKIFITPIAALTLAGCATTREPGVEIRYVEVVKEVQKPCPAKKPERPDPLARPLPTDLQKLVLVLAAKLAEYADAGNYADQADVWMDLCSMPPLDD